MREVQEAALDLFEAYGYEAVSVEAIAASAGVSAPTIYRHFGTKERIVLWDDYDPDLLVAISGHAGRLGPLAAIEAGLIESLDVVYGTDAKRVLRRARLMVATPELRLANAPLMAQLRAELGSVLETSYRTLSTQQADLLAGVVVVALENAIGRWMETRGKTRLQEHFSDAFADLRAVVLTQGAST